MKLVYFDLYGRAEAARMLLHVAKAEFEDVRLQQADWPTYRTEHADEIEFGQLPVLYHDGKQINQSQAIVRYLGRTYGYYPADAYDAWRVDSFIDAFSDTMLQLAKIQWEQDADKKIELFTKWAGETFPATLAKLEKRLAANSSQHFLVGDKLTTADFGFLSAIFSFVHNDGFEHREPLQHSLAQNPLLAAYVKHHQENTLKEYLASRPVRPF